MMNVKRYFFTCCGLMLLASSVATAANKTESYVTKNDRSLEFAPVTLSVLQGKHRMVYEIPAKAVMSLRWKK